MGGKAGPPGSVRRGGSGHARDAGRETLGHGEATTAGPGQEESMGVLGHPCGASGPARRSRRSVEGLLMVTFRKRLHFSGRVARAYLTVASQAALVLERTYG